MCLAHNTVTPVEIGVLGMRGSIYQILFASNRVVSQFYLAKL